MIKEFIKKWFGADQLESLPICKDPEPAIDQLKEIVEDLEDEPIKEKVDHPKKVEVKVVHKNKIKKKKKR